MNGRVLLDGRGLGGRSGARGIGVYVRGLLHGMATLPQAPPIDLLLTRGAPVPPEVARWHLGLGPRVPPTGTRLQPLTDPVLLCVSLGGRRYAAYHATEWGLPLLGGAPAAVTVHDMIPFLDPAYRRSRVRYALARALLHRARAVITPSRCTARDVARLTSVDPGRITVVSHGVDPEMRPVDPAIRAAVTQRWGIAATPYLLAVGVFDPRKRLRLLLETLRRVRRDHPVQLVIVGAQGGLEPAARAAIEASGLGEHTRLLGGVTSADLPALYSASACLVFTSSYEGFGLPLLEAMACGTPVAAFDNSSIREVVGDAAPLARDGDAAELADHVSQVVSGPERERRIAAGLTRAAHFTWTQAAQATLDVYERIRR